MLHALKLHTFTKTDDTVLISIRQCTSHAQRAHVSASEQHSSARHPRSTVHIHGRPAHLGCLLLGEAPDVLGLVLRDLAALPRRLTRCFACLTSLCIIMDACYKLCATAVTPSARFSMRQTAVRTASSPSVELAAQQICTAWKSPLECARYLLHTGCAILRDKPAASSPSASGPP